MVPWSTFGRTHIPRPGDDPVMPTADTGFTLEPAGFVAMDPAVGVPPSAKEAHGESCRRS